MQPAHTLAWISLLVLLFLDGPAARAQGDSARRHIEQGERYYRLSDYPAALREYEAAYRIDPRPELLYNVARCHEVMANLELAIDSYRRYLRLRPAADDREVVELRIRNLRRRLRADAMLEQPAPAPPPRRARWKAAAGWSAVGVGLSLVATGVVFGVMARDRADAFTSGVAGGRSYQALSEIERAGERYESVQIATLIAGGLVAASGGGLLLSDLHDRFADSPPAAAALTPLLGAGSLGLAAAGRF